MPGFFAVGHYLVAAVGEALHDVLLLHGNPGELLADLEWCCVAQALAAQRIHPLHMGYVGSSKIVPLRF